MSPLSDAFLRLQLRAVREQGSARLRLVDGDRPREIMRRIHALAREQGFQVSIELDSGFLSIAAESHATAALG